MNEPFSARQAITDHELLDQTRFKNLTDGIDELKKRAGRTEGAAWSTMFMFAVWALSQLFHVYTGAQAEARSHYEQIRGAVR